MTPATSYFVAFVTQKTTATGDSVKSYGMSTFDIPTESDRNSGSNRSLTRSDQLVDRLRNELERGERAYTLISSLVCKNVPSDMPMQCEVSVTLMTGGVANDVMHLRRLARSYTISMTFSLFDAFRDLTAKLTDEIPIGFAWSPVGLT